MHKKNIVMYPVGYKSKFWSKSSLLPYFVFVGRKCSDVLTFVFLLDLILYVPLTIFQLNRDGSSWVEPVLS